MWYEKENTSAKKVVLQRTESAATAEGTPIHLKDSMDSCVIVVDPVGTASLEYTYDDNFNVFNDTDVTWIVWEAGAVTTATGSQFLVAPTAVRLIDVVTSPAKVTITGPRHY